MKTTVNQPTPASHPQAINLGLPSGTRWASCNIGSSKPEEHGDHFAWAELKVKDNYDWDTYVHYDSKKNGYSNLGSCISGSKYDAAHEIWGDKWRMPTLEQIKELLDCCIFEWTALNGVNGGKFTGPNGNSIFLPAAGYRFSNDMEEVGEGGAYWSGALSPYSNCNACHLEFSSIQAD